MRVSPRKQATTRVYTIVTILYNSASMPPTISEDFTTILESRPYEVVALFIILGLLLLGVPLLVCVHRCCCSLRPTKSRMDTSIESKPAILQLQSGESQIANILFHHSSNSNDIMISPPPYSRPPTFTTLSTASPLVCNGVSHSHSIEEAAIHQSDNDPAYSQHGSLTHAQVSISHHPSPPPSYSELMVFCTTQRILFEPQGAVNTCIKSS